MPTSGPARYRLVVREPDDEGVAIYRLASDDYWDVYGVWRLITYYVPQDQWQCSATIYDNGVAIENPQPSNV